jgi:hypothetical protein
MSDLASISRGIVGAQGFYHPDYNDTRVEVVKYSYDDLLPLNLLDTGLKYGDGAADNYPAALYDGVVMGKAPLDQYDADQKNILNIGSGKARGDQYFDFAPGATAKGPMFMVFSNGYELVAGMDNKFHQYGSISAGVLPTAWTGAGATQTPDLDLNYNPGEMPSFSITGMRKGLVWLAGIHFADVDISGFAAGDDVAVYRGRFTKATAGEIVYGEIVDLYQSGTFYKALLQFDFTNGHPAA